MAHSRKRINGRSSGTKKSPMLRSKKLTITHRSQPGGKLFSTSLGFGIAIVLVLGLALIVIIARGSAIANASGGGPTTGAAVGFGSLNHPKGSCGNIGQSPCTPATPDWFNVGSESPGTVAGAILASSDFVSIKNRFGCGLLDTPALVHAYGAHTGMDYYDDDHWVISTRDTTGMHCGLFDFVYDRVHHRMRFSSYGVVTSQDPHAGQAFPYITSSVALASLRSQRKIDILAGTHLELIFFPIDPSFPYLNSPVHKWAGGGNSAMNPMWHMIGLDKKDYFLGADLNVHAQQDLPIASGQP